MQTFSADEFKKKFGESAYTSLSPDTQKAQSIIKNEGSSIGNAFRAGVGQIKQSFSDAQNASNPVEAIESGMKLGSGVVRTAGSPLAPVVNPTIGKGIEFASDKISNSPAVQKFATSKAGERTARIAEDVGYLADIAGTAAGMAEAPKVGATVKKTATGVVDAAQDLSSKVAQEARAKVGSQPAKIMQRVARLSKNKQAKFEQTAGESVGEYLTKRGIYGDIDEISTQLYDRFTRSKNTADKALAELKGTFEPAPVKTALDELMAREERVSSEGAPSPIMGRVRQLSLKLKREGLDMSEINEVKRMYEKNNKMDYLKQNLPESVARANNLDSAIRAWQFKQAETLGLKNLPRINKETRLAKQLLDDIGHEYSGQAGNNAMTLTDWIMLSGGDPTAIGGFLVKKTFSSKAVQSAIAKALNKGKPIMGEVKADIGTSQVKQLPAPTSNIRRQIGSGATIKVAPSNRNLEIVGKQGIANTVKKDSPAMGQIVRHVEPLAQEARKYKSAEEFDSAVRGKIDTVIRLAGNEVEDVRIIGSTASGKIKPNDTDVLVSLKKKSGPTTSENIHQRKEFNSVIESELGNLFPNRVHVTVADFDPKRGGQISLTDFYNKVMRKK